VKPCGHREYVEGCYPCRLARYHRGYAARWGALPPCPHQGADTGERVACEPCGGKTRLKVLACELHGRCTPSATAPPGLQSCASCPDRIAGHAGMAEPGDVPAGVVIGSFGMPGVVELGVAAVRHTCGAAVPVLVSDDASPAPEALDLGRRLARWAGVEVLTSPARLGHVGGDVAAFFRGILWAQVKGLRVLAKLSQRMIFLAARWLQRGAAELLASGLPCATHPCREDEHALPLRTEAVLLDVAAWHRPDVLGLLAPRGTMGREAPSEGIIHQALAQFLGGRYHPWGDLATRDRRTPVTTCLFHTNSSAAEYHALARQLGVDLGQAFTTRGWQYIPEVDGRGYQLPGGAYKV